MVIVGRTKIPYNDLFCYNNKEIKSIIEGHEDNIKLDFEKTRKAVGFTILPHLKKGSKLDMSEIWPFDWENKKRLIDKDLKALTNKAKERYNQIKNGKA